jgi:phosphoglycolate phosphatase-like HAD superfamily hydrolase
MDGFLLVFDLDGTLVDTVLDLRAALNEMLRERNSVWFG